MGHTPGPWAVGPTDWLISKSTGMGYRNFPVRAAGGEGFDIAMVYSDEDDDEQAANVSLIAAAPELLAACRLLLYAGTDGYACYCVDTPGEKCWHCVAAAAIDKAEGRSE